ncbi:MAG: hypothetical protein U0229_22135 [Anaeromyxobacter sp.]
MLAAACTDRPKPARFIAEPLPPSRPQRIATFEAVIEPPTPGPGGSRGSALWTTIPTGSDGDPDTNPPRTVEIASDLPFVEVGSAPGETCLGGAIKSPVHITNFMPERLVGLFVVITSLSDTDRVVCNPGVVPTGGTYDWDPDTGGIQVVNFEAPSGVVNPYGSVIDYTDVLTYPFASLAGSPVTTGLQKGETIVKDWYLNFPTGTGYFVIKGEIWADPFPNPPRINSLSLNGRAGLEQTLSWFVYDNKDDITQPETTQIKASICTAPFANGVCGGTEYPLEDFVVNGFLDRTSNGSGWGTYDAYLGDLGLTPGDHYYIQARTLFDLGGSPVEGSFAYSEDFILVGKPTFIAPADNVVLARDDSTTFSWYVDFPFETTLPALGSVFSICDTERCGAFADVKIELEYTIAPVEGPANRWTYQVTPNLAGLLPSTAYTWWIKTNFIGHHGPWQGPWHFTTGP